MIPHLNSNLEKNFQPRVNISEDEKYYYIEAELAGMKREDIKIHYDENNSLSIKTEKKKNTKITKKTIIALSASKAHFTEVSNFLKMLIATA